MIRRADGSWLYLLPSVIDDVDLKVTHPARRDHVTNSAIQVQMFEALGATPPAFAHEALLVAAEGKLSKRLGSSGVDELRAAGIEPMALNSLLARLGTSQPVEAKATLEEPVGLIFRHSAGPRRISTSQSSRSTASCSTTSIIPQSRIGPRRRRRGGMGASGRKHRSPRGLTDWSPVLDGEIRLPLDEKERAFLSEAAAAEAIDWNTDPWSQLISALKQRTDRKARHFSVRFASR